MKPLEADWVKVVQVITLVGQWNTVDCNKSWVDAGVLYEQIEACQLLFCLGGIYTSFTNDFNGICLAT